jgi:CheY-like chemotaxis protein
MATDNTVYQLTRSGSAALANPQGRVSRGFLRLMAQLDGARDLRALHTFIPNLGIDDLRLWTRELERQGLIERPRQQALNNSGSFEYEGALEMEKDDAFNRAVEQIRTSLKREQPQAEERQLTTSARLVAIESDSTTRAITEHGFFAFPSRAADKGNSGGNGKSNGGAAAVPADFLVLIVEDDPVRAHMTQTIVARDGYQTALTGDGNGLLAYLKSPRRPDLILLDVELPGGNGFDFLEKMRDHLNYKKQRVIMLTGRSERSDIARGILLGANGYVTKPYKPELLRGAIRQTLNLP